MAALLSKMNYTASERIEVRRTFLWIMIRDKSMVKEKSGIDKTETLGSSNITLEGYQFTEFEPNETEAPRFESFDTGIIVLTIQMFGSFRLAISCRKINSE